MHSKFPKVMPVIASVLGGVCLTMGSALGQGTVLQVEATLFPLVDWVRVIGGERVVVHCLLPPGADPHHFSPRPSEMRRLAEADLFVYIGDDMEPWAARMVAGLPAERRPDVVVVATGITRRPGCCDHDHAHPTEAHSHRSRRHPAQPQDDAPQHTHDRDPHVWLDPLLAIDMVDSLAGALAQRDPEGTAVYEANAAAYRQALETLHHDFTTGLANLRHREILYAGHFAFGYLAARYGLTHRTPYPGFSPNASPSPRQMANMIRHIRASEQTTLFYSTEENPRLALQLARETGLQPATLHSLHNLTVEDWKRADRTYLAIMHENLSALQNGLGTP